MVCFIDAQGQGDIQKFEHQYLALTLTGNTVQTGIAFVEVRNWVHAWGTNMRDDELKVVNSFVNNHHTRRSLSVRYELCNFETYLQR